MKKLDSLKPAKGSNVAKKRLGRGIGSGLGKTAGKGHKGQHSRKGGKVRPGFEGGQMPLYRRLPKRGFKNLFRQEYAAVNLSDLKKLGSGTIVTSDLLFELGVLREKGRAVKLLAKGSTLNEALTIRLDKVSSAAKAAIERAGGKVEGI